LFCDYNLKNNKAVLLLLIANAISGISQGITMLAVPWYFTGVLHRESLFGNIYFAVTFVSLFWGVYSGTLIDRYNRKKIFLAMNAVGLVGLGSVSAYGFLQQNIPWWLAAIPFAITVFIYNLHFPNLYAYAQEITPRTDYGKVTSLLEIQGQISFTAAGGIAAVLLQGFDGSAAGDLFPILKNIRLAPVAIWKIFALDALTYLLAFVIIYFVQSLPVVENKIDTAPWHIRLKTGLVFLLKHPLILRFGMFSLMLFLTIIIFGTQLSPIYVKQHLNRGGDVFAISDMAFSFGSLLAGIFTARLFKPHQNISGIIGLHVLAGCMYLAMLVTKTVAWFYLANFLIGFCNAGVRIQRITYIFHHIPNYVIGRASSVFFVLNVLCRMLLIALFSVKYFHTPTGILFPVLLLAVICFVAAFAIRKDYRLLQ
jgi:MFS family permease